jgi:hypothetical protein
MGMAKGIDRLFRLNHFRRFAAQVLQHCAGTSSCPGPNLASKVKMVGFPDDWGYGTLL